MQIVSVATAQIGIVVLPRRTAEQSARHRQGVAVARHGQRQRRRCAAPPVRDLAARLAQRPGCVTQRREQPRRVGGVGQDDESGALENCARRVAKPPHITVMLQRRHFGAAPEADAGCAQRVLHPARRRQPATTGVVPAGLAQRHAGTLGCRRDVQHFHIVGRQAQALQQRSVSGRAIAVFCQAQQPVDLAHHARNPIPSPYRAASRDGVAILAGGRQRRCAVEAGIVAVGGIHRAVKQARRVA